MSKLQYWLTRIGLLAALIHSPLYARESADPYAQLREVFLRAEQALQSNQFAQYHALEKQLKEYPLYPYLRYQELRENLSTLGHLDALSFLDQVKDTPLANQFRKHWLYALEKRKDWRAIATHFSTAESTRQQCSYRAALLKINKPTKALHKIEDLWVVGKSQPKQCDPVFDYWREQGGITKPLAWQRFKLAIGNGQASLAKYLLRYLSPEQRTLGEQWLQIRRRPTETTQFAHRFLNKHTYSHDDVISIVQYGLVRLASSNPQQAIVELDIVQKRHTLDTATLGPILRKIGLILAMRRAPESQYWLASVPELATDKAIQEWRIRAALNFRDWENVLVWIAALPEYEQMKPRWQYWQARAYAQLDQTETAQPIFQRLATKRNYYGFLAADLLSLPYQMNDQAYPAAEKHLIALAKLPAMQRAFELFQLGRIHDARREWYLATHALQDPQLAIAAKLAQRWGWHDRAIITMGNSQHRNDLSLRFPLVFTDQIQKHATKHQLDPAWVWSLARQESAFMVDARSGKGATGLMQLMPSTGRAVARSLGVRLRNTHALTEVDLNVRLGTKYLHDTLGKFNHHRVLATAAYNAGSARVKRWLPETGKLEADIWIETMPYHETRGYVSNILAYTAIYEYRLNKQHQRLSDAMHPIPSSEIILSNKL